MAVRAQCVKCLYQFGVGTPLYIIKIGYFYYKLIFTQVGNDGIHFVGIIIIYIHKQI